MAERNRPPYVTFETRAVEDRNATIAAGHWVGKDVDFIILIPHASDGKQRVEEVYAEWLAKIKRAPRHAIYDAGPTAAPMSESRFPDEWLDKIERAYRAFKDNQELPADGFPIAHWEAVGPAQRKMLLDRHIRTVEELADYSDEGLLSMGHGGVHLRNLAKRFLEARDKEGAGQMAQQIVALTQRNLEQEQTISQLAKRLDELTAPTTA